jgi:ribonuclease T2
MRDILTNIIAITLVVSTLSIPATAQIALHGYFIARSQCPAFQSFRQQTNPGNVVTEKDRAYTLIGKNNHVASHYLIDMDVEPSRRWVAVSCGEHVVPVDEIVTPIPNPEPGGPGGPSPENPAQRYVLAVSWQPAFCETKPSKPECVSQTVERFDASHFTLHGLWPQPQNNVYCHVAPSIVATDKDNRWMDLPALALETQTRDALNRVMPGTQSFLERHEWVKHGTCYNGEPAEKYYADAIMLMEQLNATAVRALFADNIGREITTTAIRDAFDDAFGAGAGARVKVSCKQDNNRRLITELTIGLAGNLDEQSMAEAIFAAPQTSAGCPSGIVDPVGLQ